MKCLLLGAAAVLALASLHNDAHAREKKVPECELAINGSGKYCTSEDKMDHASAASDHGFNTAALEVMCEGALVVSDQEMRAKFDKLYRDKTSKWRSDFMEGYENVVSRKQALDANKGKPKKTPAMGQFTTCMIASREGVEHRHWLKWDQAGRDLMEAKVKLEKELNQ